MPKPEALADAIRSRSNRIRHARRSAKFSQAALAAKLGIVPSAVAQWESPNGTAPTIDNLAKIALICNVDFEWLATGRGNARIGEHPAPIVDMTSFAEGPLEERLLTAFRRLALRKREPLVRCLEDVL